MPGAPARAQPLTALAQAVLARPWPGGVLAGGLLGAAVLALAVPALLLLAPFATVGAGALMTLLVLAHGASATGPLLAGMTVVVVLAVAAGMSPAGALLLVAMHGGAVVVLAAGWRRSQALALVLGAAAVVAAGAALAYTLGLDEAERAARRELLGTWVSGAAGVDMATLGPTLDAATALAGGLLGLSLLAGWVLSLLAGRSLHARVVAPGALGAEFRALRLGRGLGVVLIVLVVLAGFEGLGGRAWSAQLALVLGGLYAVQGLAVLHGLAGMRAVWPGVLWVVYGTAVIATVHMVVMCASLGVVDNWIDFRARAGRRAGPNT